MSDPVIVSNQWLEDHLDDPNVRVLEVSAKNDTASYRSGHIPGALWFFWKSFCWHDSDREFMTPQEMAERLGAIGVGPDTTLVIYGDPVQYGTYAFWALKMAGHKDVRVLDGAKTKWLNEKRPLSVNTLRYEAKPYAPPSADHSMRLGRDAVLERLGKPEYVLLDARSPEEYSGERLSPAHAAFDHGAERKGRIPGAKHLYYQSFLNEDESFKSKDEIEKAIREVGIDEGKTKEIICYCRLSHRATLLWTAMRFLLGRDDVKIYDGSWTEWGSIVGFPVER